MRVLVGCEFSGVVREAFAARGHDAWSCDLEPSEIPGKHIEGDVLNYLQEGWDLAIFHPPCTHLASSGSRWFPQKKEEQEAALEFFVKLYEAPIPRICVENPVGVVSTRYRYPNQIVHPWMFGYDESKATCLWLKDLPYLLPTNILEGGGKVRRSNQTKSGQNKLKPASNRGQIRSMTCPGIADAMALQWGRIKIP
jgi:hypothetical protein